MRFQAAGVGCGYHRSIGPGIIFFFYLIFEFKDVSLLKLNQIHVKHCWLPFLLK